MGLSGIGIWQLLIILAIVIMVFGSKKLRNLGGDLGTAVQRHGDDARDAAEPVVLAVVPALVPPHVVLVRLLTHRFPRRKPR